jgi:hypothetical protein
MATQKVVRLDLNRRSEQGTNEGRPKPKAVLALQEKYNMDDGGEVRHFE